MKTREQEAKELITNHGSQKVKEALVEVLTTHPLPTGLHVYDAQLRANEPADSWVGECNQTAWGNACAKELAHRYNCYNELLAAVKEAQWLREHIMGEKKRIDWGNTFDMDFARMNHAFIAFDKAAAKASQD